MTTRSLSRISIATVAVATFALAGCSDSTKDSVDDAASAVTSAAAEVGDDAKDAAKDAGDKVKEGAADAKDAAEAAGKKAKDSADDARNDTAGTLTAEDVHLHDGFVKAMPAGAGMTAIFGTLENHTAREIHLIGFSTSLGEAEYEIHEVVDGKMQEKEGGITIKAGGDHVLEPGADHLMILNYDKAIQAGSTVDITLKFSDGSKIVVKEVPVRAIGAGEEDYGSDSAHGDHEMGHDKDK
ncbi:copper chaperone PCu(A)C [Corynebacterium sp. CCM 9185]|uniref:Copper chaperone PCu(A)C n=1 Tax=Corynebacterium marambiense TaxID=2765364 RepID=A0ABS0VZ50_9CORY|nr:copper chaperone PCu(A)C [Corynebacterium marambiense]MBI9000597.1 copper chaperone PCu(A)C [Corynebacterium marambiense]MCK7663140.1 copper chaperone PCu(A)C [Corynebacterium marambiense]MCX7542754.1 copper chaperone PCu(A)C [Corynebacterium marambiense]